MNETESTIKIFRKSGAYLYLPAAMVKDSDWPFDREKPTKVLVRIRAKKIILEKV